MSCLKDQEIANPEHEGETETQGGQRGRTLCCCKLLIRFLTLRTCSILRDFILAIVCLQGEVPCIILCTGEQTADTRRFCWQSQPCLALTKGTTLAMCTLHLQQRVSKILLLVRRETQDHPIYCRLPILHCQSDTEIFFVFFHYLAERFGKQAICSHPGE